MPEIGRILLVEDDPKDVELTMTALEYADSNLRMRIRDNGCGIDPQTLQEGREGHWGLTGMRERATRIGGLLEIRSDTTGTEVRLSVPTSVVFQAHGA